MSRYLLLFLALLVGGCTPMTAQIRPAELEFPPLEIDFPELEQKRLANGMKFYLQEDHELPLVDITLMIEGGSIYDPAAKTGLSKLFAQALATGGTVNMSAAQLETELEAMAATLAVSSSNYSYQVDLSLHREDLPRILDILAELLRQPGFDEERLELARKQLLEEIYRKNDDPGSVAGRLLAEAVNPEHPFGDYPTVAEVKSITRADLLALHQRYFQPENFWLAVSGDVTAGELQRLLEQQFGDLQGKGASVGKLPGLPESAPGKVLVADKTIPQTTIMMGHQGVDKDNPDVMALRVANYILGGGGFNSRMMREVRSNRGLAYSAYSYFQVGRELPGLFIAGSETKSASTVEVVMLMRRLIQQLREQPVSEQELALAKKSLINSFVFAFENSHAIVSRQARLDFYGYPEDYLAAYQEKVAAVTVADVQRVARKYLHPQQLKIVLVGNSADFMADIDRLKMPVEEVQL
jgi:zinc protease